MKYLIASYIQLKGFRYRVVSLSYYWCVKKNRGSYSEGTELTLETLGFSGFLQSKWNFVRTVEDIWQKFQANEGEPYVNKILNHEGSVRKTLEREGKTAVRWLLSACIENLGWAVTTLMLSQGWSWVSKNCFRWKEKKTW